MFLEQIVRAKKEEITQLKQQGIAERDFPSTPRISLASAITRSLSPGIIAEIKPASPVKGSIKKEVNPVATALGYERGGATAISVLTDVTFFQGNPLYLMQVKKVVSLPVLRKDFILDAVQVVESKQYGADAILLIAALLPEKALYELTRFAQDIGLEVLIEVHEEGEIPRTIKAKPDVIGINNRNLTTFKTDLGITEGLHHHIPGEFPLIAESGITSYQDVQQMEKIGVDAVLVGEYLMRQSSPEEGVKQLCQGRVG